MTTVDAILLKKGRLVHTIEPDYSLHAAAGRLAQHKIGALVVCNGAGKMVGIISERDIVRALAKSGASAIARPVKDVMTKEVHTCGLHENVGSIMERMTTAKFRHFPVIVEEKVSGIISIGDVVKHRLEEIEQEQAALRDYIQQA